MRERCEVVVEGIVQGVGFRPFVYGLATARDLAGSVRNDLRGVVIEIEGERAALDAFLQDIAEQAPPLAKVAGLRVAFAAATGATAFRIEQSADCGERGVKIAADAGICDECRRELFDPADRRYRYPFLNCTHCGPRLTIIRDVPYDRERTTMARFVMCPACRAEYDDPTDRRFHAEPTACPECGPQLQLRDGDWQEIAAADPVAAAAAALRDGLIVAIKGLGGYHLACDATSEAAVSRLRQRKGREAKPLAIMVASLAAAQALCAIGHGERELLTSPRRPIVLLRRGGGGTLAAGIAHDISELGLMLPYTPLHELLLDAFGGPLVMTSGNRGDQPIVFDDEDARLRLASIADLFLTHDRPIVMRCDDSVVRPQRGEEVPLRRSRGYAPQPVALPIAARSPVLAVGSDLKGCFALARGNQAFLSHHLGDLADLATWREFTGTVAHYQSLFGIRPTVVAHDLHPHYLSTRFAAELDEVELIGVQHHHAHIAACLAEHGRTAPVIGVAFDGTGYGSDGTIWGGEFLVADLCGFERVGHLRPVALPGGDSAVRQPWRSAAAHLHAAGIAEDGLAERIGAERWRVAAQMLAHGLACAPTSSVGRLFDAAAALLGLCDTARFEAEAAIALEAIADRSEGGAYPVEFEDKGGVRVWDQAPIIAGITGDRGRGIAVATIAARFHNAVADAIHDLCCMIRREHGLRAVALSGGVFQNALLTERTGTRLAADGFEVLLHRLVPPNDGGLCFGQAAVACARAEKA